MYDIIFMSVVIEHPYHIYSLTPMLSIASIQQHYQPHIQPHYVLDLSQWYIWFCPVTSAFVYSIGKLSINGIKLWQWQIYHKELAVRYKGT